MGRGVEGWVGCGVGGVGGVGSGLRTDRKSKYDQQGNPHVRFYPSSRGFCSRGVSSRTRTPTPPGLLHAGPRCRNARNGGWRPGVAMEMAMDHLVSLRSLVWCSLALAGARWRSLALARWRSLAGRLTQSLVIPTCCATCSAAQHQEHAGARPCGQQGLGRQDQGRRHASRHR